MNTPVTLVELPESDAYVILTPKTVRLPMDPLPSGIRTPDAPLLRYFHIETFNNEEEWTDKCTEYLRDRVDFKAFLLQPVKVSIKADIQKEI